MNLTQRDIRDVGDDRVPITPVIISISIPAGNCMFKVNDRNTRTRCEICPKLTINIPERRHWCCSGVFVVNFENISQLVLFFYC